MRPEAAIAAQPERARAAGADVRPGESVLGLEERADGSVDVISTQGRCRAQQVVVAAGAWLPGFLGQQARADWARDFGVYRQVMYWSIPATPRRSSTRSAFPSSSGLAPA